MFKPKKKIDKSFFNRAVSNESNKKCPLIIFYTLAPTLKCYRCQPGEDCFQNNSTGTSVDCVDPDNTACYKIKVGKIQL